MLKKFTYPLILIVLFFFPQILNAQIAAWDFFGQSLQVSQLATISNANLTATPNLTRGAGAAASAGSNSFRTTGFQNNGISVANTDYFQLTLSAATGYKLSLSTIDAKFNGTAAFYGTVPGAASQFAYSINGITFSLIGSAVASTSLTMGQIDLSSISALQNVASGTTITLRYYASGQSATGGWGFSSSASGVYGLEIGGNLTSVATCAGPTINTTSITNVNTTSADITGNTTNVGGGTNITVRGIQYSTSSTLSSPTNNTESGTFATGSFTRNLTGLNANTDYYYRASATNNCTTPQTSYSHTSSFPSFTTLPVATTANAASNIGSNGFTANWTAMSGNAASATYTLEVDDDNTFSSVLQTQTGLTATSYNVAGLLPLTNYYYRVKVANTSGISSWSSIIGPVTTTAVLPYTPASGDWRVRSGFTFSGVSYSNQWERYNGSAWVSMSGSPINNGGNSVVRLIVNTQVEAAGNAAANTGLNFDILVIPGGEFDMYDDAGGALTAVPAYFGSNKSIRIQNGGTFLVQGDFKMPSGSSLIVESGGTVEIDQASVSVTHPMWGGTEDFQNGSLLKIDNISYATGLVNATNISANASGYLFGNLTIDITANTGNWSITEGTGTFNLCQNHLTMTNAGTKQISLLAGIGTCTVNGNIYNNSGTFSFGSQLATASGTQTININGNTEIDGTNYLKYNSSNAFANYLTTTLNLKGDLTVYNTLTDGPLFSSSVATLPVLTFNGTPAQTIASLAPLTLSNIVVNKPSADLTLDETVTVTNNITFTKGIVNTTAAKLLVLADNATATGASNNSFVNGPVQKTGNDAIEFPIGKNGRYRPAAISAPSSVSDAFTAEYFFNPHPNATVNAPLNHISSKEYWDINRSGSSPVDVTLTWDALSQVNETLDVRIAHFNNSSWDDLTTSGLTVNTTTDRVTKTGVNSFSPFTIGTINGAQPLPVRIRRFDAVKDETETFISYELNNVEDGETATVQRSNDGKTFEDLFIVTPGRTAVFIKNFTDTNPLEGYNHYRLTCRANNGSFTFSKVISLIFDKNNNLHIYPNPAGNKLSISWKDRSIPAEISIYSSTGKLVRHTNVSDASYYEVSTDNLPDGVYFVKWRQGNQQQQSLVHVQH